MKLSEAIRLGAVMSEQGFGRLSEDGKRCALGAALEACGHVPFEAEHISLYIDGSYADRLALDRLFPALPAFLNMECPACKAVVKDACDSGGLIPHLNDIHRWSRERIADFVELHEPAPLPENPSPELLEYWADRSELFERSELPSGVAREC